MAISDKIGSYIASGVALAAIAGMLTQCGERKALERQLTVARSIQKQTDDNLARCSGNVSALQKGIQDRNAEIEAARKAFDAKAASAEQANERTRKDLVAARARVKALSAPLVGYSQCERLLEADDRVLEALK